MIKLLVVILLVVITVSSVIVLFSGSDYSSSSSVANQPPVNPETTLYIGNQEAPVTLVEYLDFKCQCNQFHQTTAKELKQAYVDTNKAKIEVRAFPFLGPDSGRALRGAYCANVQGLFEPYHDVVLDYI